VTSETPPTELIRAAQAWAAELGATQLDVTGVEDDEPIEDGGPKPF